MGREDAVVAATIADLLDLIPEDPDRVTVRELRERLLARGMERDVRSIQRQLRSLRARYPLKVIEASTPYQWCFHRGRKPRGLSQDPHTALALAFVYEKLPALLPPDTVGILRRQQADYDRALRSSSLSLGDWRDLVRIAPPGLARLAPAIAGGVTGAVYDALMKRRMLEVAYRKRGASTATPRRLGPLGLVQRGPLLTLVCVFDGKETPATIQLHRIEAARVLADACRSPAAFDLDAFIAGGALSFRLDDEPLALELRVAPGAVESFREAPLSTDQALTVDDHGAGCLTATVPDTADLRGLLMSYGEAVEIVGPDHLRRFATEEVRAMAQRYGLLPGQPAPAADLREKAARSRRPK